jgi:nitrate/TMAO reductase-like tetraheme cytochrome c subunit
MDENKELKELRKKPVRRTTKHLFVPIMGLLFLAVLVVGVPFYWTSQPGFCGSCHIMKPYYSTWHTSTHAKLGCLNCHEESGTMGLVKSRINITKNILVNFTKRPDKVTVSTKIDNTKCYECHNSKRKVTPAGDLKLPPRHHLVKDNKLQCVQCHRKLVHNEKPTGKNKPREAVCVKCHQEQKISTECRTCHYEK